MTKLTVTQTQAEEIKRIKDVDDAINGQMFNVNEADPLMNLTPAELARALHVGYDVEHIFKVGDWIVTKGTKRVGIVKKIISRSGEGWLYHDLNNFGDVFDAFRHATSEEIQQEKQRRWWKKHDRKVWEFKSNDVVSCQDF